MSSDKIEGKIQLIYPEQSQTFEGDFERIFQKTYETFWSNLPNKSPSIVEQSPNDSDEIIRRLLNENKLLNEGLTRLQARCTELQNSVRELEQSQKGGPSLEERRANTVHRRYK